MMNLRLMHNCVVFAIVVLHISLQTSGASGIAKSDEQDLIWSCNADDGYILSDNQVPGKCDTFDDAPCLCDLNSNCGFDQSANKCLTKIDCRTFGGNAGLCRANGCFFDCAAQYCTRFDGTSPTCNAVLGSCHKFCFDPCMCKINECDYTNDGKCLLSSEPIESCPDSLFSGSECGMPDVFYNNNGVICRNGRQRGNCDIDKTVIAYNFYGESFTDYRGVDYITHPPIKRPELANSEFVGGQIIVGEEEKPFYSNFLVSRPDKREPSTCMSYQVFLCEEGYFELTIKTAVITDVYPGEKAFNIKLGPRYVFAELDVMKIAKKKFWPVTLALNFQFKNNILFMKDHAPFRITNGSVDLQFCYGNCVFLEGNVEIAAVSILKFIDTPINGPTQKECQRFDKMPWECLAAKCDYCEELQICRKRKSGSTTFCPAPNITYCPEIHFMVDGRQNHLDPDMLGYTPNGYYRANHVVIQTNLLKNIISKWPCSKFGFSIYNDFWAKAELDDKNQGHHQEKQGCFLPYVPLTDDVTNFRKELSAWHTFPKWYCRHEVIPIMFHAMLAATKPEIGFTKGNPYKYIVIVTSRDVGCKKRIDPPLPTRDAVGDGTDDCVTTKLPSFRFLRDVFRREKFHFFVVRPNWVPEPNWRDWLGNKLSVPYDIVLYDNTTSSWNYCATKIFEFIGAQQTGSYPAEIPLTEVGCPYD